MNKGQFTESYKKWQLHCEEVQKATAIDFNESKKDKLQRIARAQHDYSFFVHYYFPHYAKSKTARFQIATANRIKANSNAREVLKWARGHAKSTHIDIMIPMWLKIQQPRQINVYVIVGKSEDNAQILLADLQAELQFNQRFIHDFGPQYNSGHWAEGEFVTRDGVAFFARGRGQSPRGLRYREQRPDYIAIDDIDDDELVQNESRTNKLVDWIKEALFGALDGGRGRFIMVGNLINKNSVLAKIAASEGVEVTQVNVYDHNGNVTWEDKWTKEEIRAMEEFMGYRSFQKEYMNNPISEGAVFKQDWIRWKKLPALKQYDHIIAYCDPSFKSSRTNDYKAIKVWGKIGTELHNIANFVRQCTTAEMVRWFYDFHESLPEDVLCDYFIEANFLQDILLDDFAEEGHKRGYQLPIRPDKRSKPDKFQRIESISPLWERGFTYYNVDLLNDRDTQTGLDQLLSFEKGSRSHDDAPDADEGAIYILQKRTRSELFKPRIGKRSNSKNIW